MGVYTEYLDKMTGFSLIEKERKVQIQRIADSRGHAVLTIASDMGGSPEKAGVVGIDYTDLLPVADQLEGLSGEAIDVILETPGGLAERAEDIVRMIRDRFKTVSFIVPGAAMSAGTIMAMSGDEILLEPRSSLGPIDAQVHILGKHFSAEAFLEGLEKIKKEVEETRTLNRAYIPILQGISPGEIQTCQNAQEFSKELVSKWLVKWKFRTWEIHRSNKIPVTLKEKEQRAEEIAAELCKHSLWLTHGRSIKMEDLRNMKLDITDYTEDQDLSDAIRRYYTLLRMSFEGTGIYKLFETPKTQIYRFLGVPVPLPPRPDQADVAQIDYKCPRCGKTTRIQANIGKKGPLQQGSIPFPADNSFTCSHCGLESSLADLRKQIEAQTKKPVVS